MHRNNEQLNNELPHYVYHPHSNTYGYTTLKEVYTRKYNHGAYF